MFERVRARKTEKGVAVFMRAYGNSLPRDQPSVPKPLDQFTPKFGDKAGKRVNIIGVWFMSEFDCVISFIHVRSGFFCLLYPQFWG
jgi:hypothetical protein